jgi:hypothetical protein
LLLLILVLHSPFLAAQKKSITEVQCPREFKQKWRQACSAAGETRVVADNVLLSAAEDAAADSPY